MVHRAGGTHDVLLDHQAAHVVGPVEEGQLADLAPLRHPTRLDVGDVVEKHPGHRLGLQVFERTGRGDLRHLGVLRLERPADERRESPGLVLQVADPLQVFDPFGEGLDVAEHHGGRAPATEEVPLAVDLQPVVGEHLAARHRLPHPIDEDLATTAGERTEAGPGEPLQHFHEGALRDLREVVDLRRRETVDVDGGVVVLDVAEHLLVPLQRQRGVEPTLKEDLVATEGHRLPDLRQQHVAVEDVALGVLRRTVEGAEVTDRGADVGVVDVAVDVVGPPRLRVEPLRHRMGRPADRRQPVRFEEPHGVGGAEPPAIGHHGEDGVDRVAHALLLLGPVGRVATVQRRSAGGPTARDPTGGVTPDGTAWVAVDGRRPRAAARERNRPRASRSLGPRS